MGARLLGPKPSDVPDDDSGLTSFSMPELNRLRDYLERPELEEETKEHVQQMINFKKKISLQDIPNFFDFVEDRVTAFLGL